MSCLASGMRGCTVDGQPQPSVCGEQVCSMPDQCSYVQQANE